MVRRLPLIAAHPFHTLKCNTRVEAVCELLDRTFARPHRWHLVPSRLSLHRTLAAGAFTVAIATRAYAEPWRVSNANEVTLPLRLVAHGKLCNGITESALHSLIARCTPMNTPGIAFSPFQSGLASG